MTSVSRDATRAAEARVLQLSDWVALALPGLVWGSSFFLIAEGLEAFSPYTVTFARVCFGFFALAMVPAARVPLGRAAWPRIVALGLLWMAAPLTLFSLAEQRVSSSVTGMLNSGTPIFAALVAAGVAWLLPPRRQMLGLAIGVAGMAITALPSWSQGSSSAAGVVMIVTAIACYGVALNLAGPLQREFGSLPVIVRALATAALITAPLGIVGASESAFEWRSMVAVMVLGAGGTGLAFVLMAANAGKYGSTRAASTTYLIPPVALALGVVFRGESVAVLAIVGSAIALAGAYLVNTAQRSAS